MKFLAASALAFLALTTGTAHAESLNNIFNAAGLPPAEYDHPFKGTTNVLRVGPEIMGRMCPKSRFPVTLSCVYGSKDECAIIMLHDNLIREMGWTYEVVYRHEVGHCNGWPATHGGSRMCNADSNCKLPSQQSEQLRRADKD
jgi:hypothetical protein